MVENRRKSNIKPAVKESKFSLMSVWLNWLSINKYKRFYSIMQVSDVQNNNFYASSIQTEK